jgi:hypothetical protein
LGDDEAVVNGKRRHAAIAQLSLQALADVGVDPLQGDPLAGVPVGIQGGEALLDGCPQQVDLDPNRRAVTV